MDQFTRRIIGFGVHAGDVNGVALCRMFNAAISSQGAPRYLSSDNDPLFLYHQWQANLRILGTDEVKTVPYAPLSHPFVERLIGTIRREFLDQTLFWNTSDLERKLVDFRQYYNSHRVHTALDNTTLVEMPGKTISCYAELSQFQWKSHCRGLYQLPAAAQIVIRHTQAYGPLQVRGGFSMPLEYPAIYTNPGSGKRSFDNRWIERPDQINIVRIIDVWNASPTGGIQLIPVQPNSRGGSICA